MVTAAEVWRDYEVDGVPSSGPHKPIKSDIRLWGAAIEAIGGLAVPGAALVPLFSNGVGNQPVYRAITGFDLPNPALDTPGAVLAKPGVANQVVSGLGTDGALDFASVTGTGNVVLSDAPAFSGIIKHGLLNFLSSVGSTHIFYAPDGRLGVQLAASTNFYKAPLHGFYNVDGTDLFAQLDANTFDLQPATLTGSSALSAAKVTQTWNTSGTPRLIDLQVIDTASNAASQIFRVRTGAAGTTQVWAVDKSGAGSYASNLAVGGVLVIGSQNYLFYNGTQMDHFSPTGGIRWLNNAGNKVREQLADSGLRSYFGNTSGQHDISTPAAASGASTWPLTTGEIWNTGMGVANNVQTIAVDFNTANTDYPITIKLPAGFTRYRLASVTVTNTGTAASITTATCGIFDTAGGGGTALVASGTSLAALTSNAPLTAGAVLTLTLVAAAGATAYQTDTTLFFRVQTAQGSAASGFVTFQVIPIS